MALDLAVTPQNLRVDSWVEKLDLTSHMTWRKKKTIIRKKEKKMAPNPPDGNQGA